MSSAAGTADQATPMTVEQFVAWHENQPETEQYELLGGRPVLMAPERLAHVEAKGRAFGALLAAARGGPCRAYVDGLLIPISPCQAHQPDALLRCGPPLPPDTKFVPDPVVIVEVMSPSSARIDLVRNMEAYFSVDSVRHYVVVNIETRRLIHFRRDAPDQPIQAVFVAEGEAFRLDPPGLDLAAADFLPEPEAAQ